MKKSTSEAIIKKIMGRISDCVGEEFAKTLELTWQIDFFKDESDNIVEFISVAADVGFVRIKLNIDERGWYLFLFNRGEKANRFLDYFQKEFFIKTNNTLYPPFYYLKGEKPYYDKFFSDLPDIFYALVMIFCNVNYSNGEEN